MIWEGIPHGPMKVITQGGPAGFLYATIERSDCAGVVLMIQNPVSPEGPETMGTIRIIMSNAGFISSSVVPLRDPSYL